MVAASPTKSSSEGSGVNLSASMIRELSDESSMGCSVSSAGESDDSKTPASNATADPAVQASHPRSGHVDVPISGKGKDKVRASGHGSAHTSVTDEGQRVDSGSAKKTDSPRPKVVVMPCTCGRRQSAAGVPSSNDGGGARQPTPKSSVSVAALKAPTPVYPRRQGTLKLDEDMAKVHREHDFFSPPPLEPHNTPISKSPAETSPPAVASPSRSIRSLPKRSLLAAIDQPNDDDKAEGKEITKDDKSMGQGPDIPFNGEKDEVKDEENVKSDGENHPPKDDGEDGVRTDEDGSGEENNRSDGDDSDDGHNSTNDSDDENDQNETDSDSVDDSDVDKLKDEVAAQPRPNDPTDAVASRQSPTNLPLQTTLLRKPAPRRRRSVAQADPDLLSNEETARLQPPLEDPSADRKQAANKVTGGVSEAKPASIGLGRPAAPHMPATSTSSTAVHVQHGSARPSYNFRGRLTYPGPAATSDDDEEPCPRRRRVDHAEVPLVALSSHSVGESSTIRDVQSRLHRFRLHSAEDDSSHAHTQLEPQSRPHSEHAASEPSQADVRVRAELEELRGEVNTMSRVLGQLVLQVKKLSIENNLLKAREENHLREVTGEEWRPIEASDRPVPKALVNYPLKSMDHLLALPHAALEGWVSYYLNRRIEGERMTLVYALCRQLGVPPPTLENGSEAGVSPDAQQLGGPAVSTTQSLLQSLNHEAQQLAATASSLAPAVSSTGEDVPARLPGVAGAPALQASPTTTCPAKAPIQPSSGPRPHVRQVEVPHHPFHPVSFAGNEQPPILNREPAVPHSRHMSSTLEPAQRLEVPQVTPGPQHHAGLHSYPARGAGAQSTSPSHQHAYHSVPSAQPDPQYLAYLANAAYACHNPPQSGQFSSPSAGFPQSLPTNSPYAVEAAHKALSQHALAHHAAVQHALAQQGAAISFREVQIIQALHAARTGQAPYPQLSYADLVSFVIANLESASTPGVAAAPLLSKTELIQLLRAQLGQQMPLHPVV